MKKLLLLSVLLAACSDDPIDVTCARPLACDVDGVDLALLSVRADSVIADWGSAVVIDADNITVEFVVVNRGNETAAATDVVIKAFDLTATVRIPALTPGDTAVGTAPFVIDRAYLYAGQEAEARNITAEVVGTDAEPGNNRLNSAPHVLNLAYVAVQPTLDAPQTVSVGNGGNVLARWTWDQGFLSAVDADDAIAFLVCLRRGSATCTAGSWQALGRVETINFRQISRFFQVTPATVAASVTGEYQIMVCTVPRAHTGLRVDLSNPDHHCEPGGLVNVLP